MKQGRLINKRAALYQRYSTDSQNESSLADQLFRNKEFVAREGGDVSKVLVFQDAAISGTTFSRPGLDEMFKLVDARAIDVIVVEDLSRLSRDEMLTLLLNSRLRKAGVTLHAVNDGIDTSERSARMMVGLRALLAATYIEEVKVRTMRGLEGRARDGLSTGGRLFGYTSEVVTDGQRGVIAHSVIVHAEQATIVERIFLDYAAGDSCATVATSLNAERVDSPRAKPKPGSNPKYHRRGWSSSTIRAILHNTTYIGERKFKQRTWTTGEDGRRTSTLNPAAEVMTIPCPAIIETDLWDRVQKRLRAVHAKYTRDETGRAKGRAAQPGRPTTHLLSGVMKCSCGASMVLVGGSSRKYYGCNDNKKRGSHICSNALTIAEDTLREAVVAGLSKDLTSNSAALLLQKRLASLLAEHNRTGAADMSKLQDALKQTEGRIKNLVDCLADGEVFDSVRTSLRELEALARSQRVALRDLELMGGEATRPPTKDELRSQGREFEKLLRSNPNRGREALLQVFPERLTLDPQPGRYYVARGNWLPFAALTAAPKMTKPRSVGPGSGKASATALSCAGRI